ncbi:hypothetical protein [Shewanella frigidimarina]|jgi:hypothetical protein|uniref:hypothetical protein n=1 Tax=Shewanella frigidimarina TaxID=56812 RepID=UPI003FA0EFC7|tara:strand:- start:3016 stop:3177 length:162 start_codon:yes stop_codon:yes gene_type:complete
MSAATEYCDREIAKCKDMIRTWPNEAPCLKRLIKGWKRTKQQLQQSSTVKEVL